MYTYTLTDEQFGILFYALQACKGPGGDERHLFLEALDAWGKKAHPIAEENAALPADKPKRPLPEIRLERSYLRGLKRGMLAAFNAASQIDIERFYAAADILGFPRDWAAAVPKLPQQDDLVLDREEIVLDKPAPKASATSSEGDDRPAGGVG